MNNSTYEITTMFPLILAAALATAPLHADEEAPTETRQTISLNEGWRFQKGWFTLPGRTPVSGWRYRMDPQGEASAATMAAPGLDTSGADWREGSKFDARKGQKEESILQGWLAVGDMNRNDAFTSAWFRAEVPGKAATRPALEISKIHRIAHIYVNGVKLARLEGAEEEFTVELGKAWKPEGTNTVAILLEGLNSWGSFGDVHFVDLDNVVLPATHPISPEHDDSNWRIVDAPHDYIVEGKIERRGGDGYTREPAIYRKMLTKPELPPGGRVWLEFDGVYRMSNYWLNGKHIDVHPGGFVMKRIDVTDELNDGENSLVVTVNPVVSESGYDGAGIYRPARMVVVAPVHVAPDSLFVTSTIPDPKDGITAPAEVQVSAEIDNAGKTPVNADIVSEVVDADGRVVKTATQSLRLAAGGATPLKQTLPIAEAKLWSCENPVLYTLNTTVKVDGQPVDHVATTFGIRKIAFDAQRGFLLNGKVVKIKGICSRPNHAGVGHAMPRRLTEWRLEQLKKMGGNAYRCAHYGFDTDFYDACDRMGILVMDEFRTFGDGSTMLASDKTTTDALVNQTIQIKSHRNHPSIIMWCIGNEGGGYQNNPNGGRIAGAVKKLVDTLDGTRPTTYANNGSLGPGLTSADAYTPQGVSGAVDIVGVNYNSSRYDKIREIYPDKPMVGTESCSELATRGFYDRTPFENKMRGPTLYGNEELCSLSAYSENRMGWSATCEEGWKAVAERPWVMGYFVWSGFDYQGEPTPFIWPGQPANSCQYGIMDFCGFPKDSFWYYKSWWGSEPVLHVFPHWNWPGKEGQDIPVWVHSNCDEVELFLNGKSLGKKKMERNGHLEWQVPYAPGKLEAKGTRQGKQLSAVRETTGDPAGITLAPDRTALTADGADLAWVEVGIVDDQNRNVPTAGNLVRFSIQGPAKILGVGNGDPTSGESVKGTQRSAFNGLCMVLVQTTRTPGDIILTAESDGLQATSVSLKSDK